MPDNQLYTNEAAIKKASVIKTNLALSKLRLVKSGITIIASTTKAAMVAQEADFSGYTAGGYTLTAWTGPLSAQGGGANILTPLVNISFVTPEDDPPVVNTIGGWWVEDAAGIVRLAGNFDPARPMQSDTDGIAFVVQVTEAKNPIAPPG